MSTRWAYWMPVLLSLVVGGLVWALNWAAAVPTERKEFSPQLPDMFVDRVQVRRFDPQGRLVSQLTASSARHVPQADTMWFEAPRLLQTRPGMPTLTLIGEQAKTEQRAAEVWFYGAVEMRRAADAKHAELLILTRDMYVHNETQIARSSAPVTAEMGSHRARAIGFVADNRNETLQLLSQVSMTYVPNKANAGTAPRRLP